MSHVSPNKMLHLVSVPWRASHSPSDAIKALFLCCFRGFYCFYAAVRGSSSLSFGKTKLIFFSSKNEDKQHVFKLVGLTVSESITGSSVTNTSALLGNLKHQRFVLMFMQVSVLSNVIRWKKANNKMVCFLEEKERWIIKLFLCCIFSLQFAWG